MFDYTSNIRSRKTVPCTPEVFDIVIRSTKVGRICAEIADYREKKLRGEMSREDFETKKAELKKCLPAFLFHAHYSDGHRSNASAVPSGLSIYDIDHIQPQGGLSRTPFGSPVIGGQKPLRGGDGSTMLNTESGEAPLGEVLRQHVLSRQPITDEETIKRMKELGIVLAHISPSGEGLRLVFVIPPASVYQGNPSLTRTGETEGVLPMAQKWLASELGDKEFDEACKDLARCSFAVPADYILYMDKTSLFSNHSITSKVQPTNKVNNETDNNNSIHHSDDTHSERHAQEGQGGDELAKPSAESLRIFDETVKASNLRLSDLNAVGTRHNSLIIVLSKGLCRLMPKEQLKAVISVRMPEFSKESDCRQLIDDWYQKYTDPTRPMSVKLQKIFTDSLGLSRPPLRGGDGATEINSGEDDIDIDPETSKTDGQKKSMINDLGAILPIGLRESVRGLNINMQMPVLLAILPFAAAYADGVTVRYCDGRDQQLGLMSIIVGPQASGKSVCKDAVDKWLAPMLADDARAREIEDKWRDARRRRKANEKAPEDPHVLIRFLPITTSMSNLLRRSKNAHGHCLCTFGEELDTFIKALMRGAWSVGNDFLRVCFDGGLFGQDYNSDNSESGIVNARFNFSVLGTYGALNRFFKGDNVENGLSSRIMIAEMPDNSFAPMPTFTESTAKTDAAIQEAVDRLRSASGFLDTPRLRKAISEWVEKKRLEAMANLDYVKDTYRKRAAVIGFRCGVIYRILEGKESKKCLEFAETIADYVLEEQCKLFGDKISNEYYQASTEAVYHTENNSIFDSLPVVFTRDDLRAMKGQNVTNNALKMIIHRWKSSGWIKKVGINRWQKEK